MKCACGRILWYDAMKCPRCGRSTETAMPTLEAYGSEDDRGWETRRSPGKEMGIGETLRAELKRGLQGDLRSLLLPDTFNTTVVAIRRALKARSG